MNRRPTGSRSNTCDSVQGTIKGAFVGAAVKIVSDEQERPTILGTARVQVKAEPLSEMVQIRPAALKIFSDLVWEGFTFLVAGAFVLKPFGAII